jgi:hypothetical protein
MVILLAGDKNEISAQYSGGAFHDPLLLPASPG